MRKKTNIILILFIFLSALVLISNKFFPLDFLDNLLQKTFSAPLSLTYSLKSKIFSPKNSELEKIKLENRKLVEKIIDHEKLKKDNTALRSQFESDFIKAQKLIPSRIVGFSGRYDYPNALIIDKGKDQGIKIGSGVISEKNLVGKIANVSANFSEVILSTNKNFRTLGKTLEKTAVGVISGEEDFILFDKVIITDTLLNSDIVLTKGEMDKTGIGIPADLVVGKIESIHKVDNKPFQSAKIKSLIDFSRLETVFVIGN